VLNKLLTIFLMFFLLSACGGGSGSGSGSGTVNLPGSIITIAGNNLKSKLLSSENLKSPSSVAIDVAGNIYISDSNNNRILKVVVSTGITTTVAGKGTSGYSGDGGLATSATLNTPLGIAVDNVGNLYIADYGNRRIRKVTISTGIINTLVGDGTTGTSADGTLATSAHLGDINGVAVDSLGNIYFAENHSNHIRKVTASTGIMTTAAGTYISGYSGDGGLATSANLSNPECVAVDQTGNLYIADTDNHCIRKVTIATSIITTVAGNGTAGYSGDGNLATTATLRSPRGISFDSTGNLYIADCNNSLIRKVVISTGIISTVAGNGTIGYSGDGGDATSASFNFPNSIAVDSVGNFYIADSGNDNIRKVTALTGIVSTVAGNGVPGYAGDGGLATSAKLCFPIGVNCDSYGNLYIADCNNHRIRKLTYATGIISTVAGNGIQGHSGDGGLATSASLDFPTGVAVDSAGSIYIADNKNNTIRKVSATTGIITTVAGNGADNYSGDGGPATSASLKHPTGVTVDSLGNIYIADYGNHVIRKVTASTGIITTVAGNGIFGYSGDGGLATSAKLNSPGGIAIDSTGNLYIADDYINCIRKVTATGIITTVAGNGTSGNFGDGGPATSASFNSPTGVAVDSLGNIYIADSNNNRIRKVTAATGIITTVAGNSIPGYSGDGSIATSAFLNTPSGVAVDGSENLYISDLGNNVIRKILH